MKNRKPIKQIAIRSFDPELHHACKVRAAQERMPLNKWFEEACREKLERGDNAT